MKWLVLVVVFACGGKKDDPPPPKEEPSGLTGKPSSGESTEGAGGGLAARVRGSLTDKAKDLGDRAKAIGEDVAGTAKAIGKDAVDVAKSVATKAGQLSEDALAKGDELKSNVKGKLAFTDFDIAVEEVIESEADHKARLAAMKQIKVGDYMVGLAQDAKNPLGTVYKWQFRLAWRIPATERVIVLSLFTNEELAELDNAATLLVLVTAAERVVKLP